MTTRPDDVEQIIKQSQMGVVFVEAAIRPLLDYVAALEAENAVLAAELVRLDDILGHLPIDIEDLLDE